MPNGLVSSNYRRMHILKNVGIHEEPVEETLHLISSRGSTHHSIHPPVSGDLPGAELSCGGDWDGVRHQA